MAMSMQRWVNKVAVVTGTTSGIGKGIAELLVNEGVKVVGFARREDLNEDLAAKLANKKGTFHPLKVDITDEESIINAFKWIKDNLGPVHILINNAGILQNTTLIAGETEKWKKTFDTNVMGLCICTREAIESMKANKIDGHIIHVNSIGGHRVVPFPYVNVYCASKYAVTALTETLKNELAAAKSKIKITSISPEVVKTDIMVGVSDEKFMENAYKTTPHLTTEDVAETVKFILSTPPHMQINEINLGAV